MRIAESIANIRYVTNPVGDRTDVIVPLPAWESLLVAIEEIQEAKNKFSQVVADALRDGPQIITRHGTEVAVLLSYQEYKRVIESSRHAQTKLSQFFWESPLADGGLDFGRDTSDARVVLEL